MDQGGFDFAAQPFDVRTVTPLGQPKPPIAPATGVSRHCSAMGAQKARGFAGEQRARLLAFYEAQGPLTDAELETLSKIDRSSITARRNELIVLGLVEKDDGRTRRNEKTGISNTLWRMRVQGRGIAAGLARHAGR